MTSENDLQPAAPDAQPLASQPAARVLPKTIQTAAGQSIANPYAQHTPNIGDTIGPHTVSLAIGEGAMANIYKVWHKDLEVFRAIKILKKGYTQEIKDRFLTEAKILADIRHPNIVEIHTIGYWHETIPYIEMEYVNGLSLKQVINQQGKLHPVFVIAIGHVVCQALHYAHHKDYTLYGKVYNGLIHRDIKPENIILSKEGIIKLMDFGIARPSEVSLHTVGEKIVGSLPYLSPEQLNGQTLDQRSDIYSLGTVLYEMVTGQRVYPQKTISELVRQKSAGQYPPLSSFNLVLPQRFTDIIVKCMAPDGAQRFGSAGELGRELYALLHELTNDSPSELLLQFVQSPDALPKLLTQTQSPPPKKSGSKTLRALGIVVTIAALVALAVAATTYIIRALHLL